MDCSATATAPGYWIGMRGYLGTDDSLEAVNRGSLMKNFRRTTNKATATVTQCGPATCCEGSCKIL